jgi:hypothetical protein
MSSKRRRAASRANGKKSQGPVTPEGKARSAANATRHGLAAPGRLADSVCLTIENRAEFVQLHETFVAWHAPANPIEHLLVEEMAVARWRLQRAWVMETSLLENQMDRMTDTLEKDYETMDEGTRLTLAFRDLSEQSPSLTVLQRYESRLSRQFERCLKRLTAIRGSTVETPELLEIQTILIPQMNTHKLPLNLLNQPRLQPVNRLRTPIASANPQLLPLNRHPKWVLFIQDLNETILKLIPNLHPPFLELLDRADLL